ncbi:MAG: anion permease, partial [Veillonella sp.]|nr:anion permease [Veillonella sp.]
MKNKLIAWLIPILVGIVIWNLPIPEGVKADAWHLFAIFLATIIAFITGPASMGTIAIMAIVLTTLLKVLPVGTALSGFSNSTIWLIVAAFLLSRGF